LLDYSLRNLSGERKKLGSWYSIGKNNLKKDSRFSVPIVAECWRYGDDLWTQGLGGLGDGRKKLRLLSNGFSEIHEVIIPHLAAICRFL